MSAAVKNPKGALIELCQGQGLGSPVFETSGSGPDHEPLFNCEVLVKGSIRGTGKGRSKREAERAAAQDALDKMQSGQRPAAVRVPSFEQSGQPFVTVVEPGKPWPILPEVLAAALAAAAGRVPAEVTGAEGAAEIRRLAFDLYAGLLQDLGEYRAAGQPPSGPAENLTVADSESEGPEPASP